MNWKRAIIPRIEKPIDWIIPYTSVNERMFKHFRSHNAISATNAIPLTAEQKFDFLDDRYGIPPLMIKKTAEGKYWLDENVSQFWTFLVLAFVAFVMCGFCFTIVILFFSFVNSVLR